LEKIQEREREERFSLVSLFARILGGGLGMRSDTLEAMLNAYKDELTQTSYTPGYAAYQRRRKKAVRQQKKKKKLSDDALLRKLEGLTAPEEMPPPTKAGARRR
jgi:hypothetical protein